ncbi:unnamed protein product [Caenorhabditis auriculariae]|uniref:Tudor domain-containing protein n=1 Tax=Caenorhabditis auriculariae TaxID=2777116 RepID=A0A8S1H6J4_9PELO|nr:unnamed protein product [Caenorhabditis auriculariae]
MTSYFCLNFKLLDRCQRLNLLTGCSPQKEMSVKEQRRIQEFVHQSIQEVLRAHDEVCRSTSKKACEEHWNRLTHNITILRRRLSKLETHGYEVLSKRFDKLRAPVMQETLVSELSDPWETQGIVQETFEVNVNVVWPEATAPRSPLAEMENFEDEKSELQSIDSLSIRDLSDLSEKSSLESQRLDSPVPEEVIVAEKPTNKLNLEGMMDEFLVISTDEKDTNINSQLAEQEMNKDLYNLIRDTRLVLPAAIPFSKDSEFPAKIVYIISPIEFYIVKQSHLKVLRQMEKVLDACVDKLIRFALSDENYKAENACLVLEEKLLYRAVIKVAGQREVQVYLVDYGRPKFVARDKCYPIPKCIANMAPPLAHCCTLHDADSRVLDNEAMTRFHEKAANHPDVLIQALGETRQSHGQLVVILEHNPILQDS